jgi:hypothetical protein
MSKTVEEMSVSELRDAMYRKQEQENMEKFSTKKEAKFNLSEIKTLESKSNGSLYHVRVEDGCEGWECLVEVDRSVQDEGYYEHEELVKNHLINFMMDKSYYEEGDIEEIRVEEICRYSRPIFKITV